MRVEKGVTCGCYQSLVTPSMCSLVHLDRRVAERAVDRVDNPAVCLSVALLGEEPGASV